MLAGMRQVVQCKLQPGQLNCAPPSRRWCHRAAPTRHQRATGVITSPHTRQRSERTNDIAHAPFWRWRKSAFFKVLIKIKYISIKTLDRNQVHFKPVNQKLSKAVPPQSPAADLARRAKAGMAAQDARRRRHHHPLPNLPQARWWHRRDLPRVPRGEF